MKARFTPANESSIIIHSWIMILKRKKNSITLFYRKLPQYNFFYETITFPKTTLKLELCSFLTSRKQIFYGKQQNYSISCRCTHILNYLAIYLINFKKKNCKQTEKFLKEKLNNFQKGFMLQRDYSDGFDYTYKYHPKTDYITFCRDVFYEENRDLKKIYIDRAEYNHIIASATNYRKYGSIACFSLSFLFILCYKKIPYFNQIQNQWANFFIQLSSVVAPFCGFHYGYDYYENWYLENYNEQLYKNRINGYKAFKETGDFCSLDKNLKSNISFFIIFNHFWFDYSVAEFYFQVHSPIGLLGE